MVSPEEWGPGAWDLLHGIAEHLGNHTNRSLIQDEQNELRLCLRHFWSLLPCLKCQNHYKEWVLKNPPDSLISNMDIKDSIREWVYKLHENVNKSRDVSSGIELSSLSDRYSKINLRKRAEDLKSFYQRGLLLRILKAETWKVGWKHLDLLLRIIG